MKVKLLQILLGAVGSAITVVISHMASAPPEVATTVGLAIGPLCAATFGNMVS